MFLPVKRQEKRPPEMEDTRREDFLGRPVDSAPLRADGPETVSMGAADRIGMNQVQQTSLEKATSTVLSEEFQLDPSVIAFLDRLTSQNEELVIGKFATRDVPEWGRPPIELHRVLGDLHLMPATDFIRHFELSNASSSVFGSTETITRILHTWQRSATAGEWTWLANHLGAMLDKAAKSKSTKFEADLLPLAQATLAFSLVRSVYHTQQSERTLEMRRGVEQALGLSSQYRRMLQTRDNTPDSAPPATESLVRALVSAHLELWTRAQAEVVQAFLRHSNDKTRVWPRADVAYLVEYRDILDRAGRVSDFTSTLFNIPKIIAPFCRQLDSAPSNPALSEAILSAIASIQRPAEWFERTYGWTPESQRQAGMLFSALSRYQSKVDDALQVFRKMRDTQLQAPLDASSRFCLTFCRLAMRQEAIEIYEGIRQTHPDVTHNSLSRLLHAFASIDESNLVISIFKDITSRFNATKNDRMLVVHRLAQQGEVERTLEALPVAYGMGWAGDPAACAMMQLAYVNANDEAGAERLLRRIISISPSVRPFNSLLQLYSDRGEIGKAASLFNDMTSAQIQPDATTFGLLINLYANRNDLDAVGTILDLMTRADVDPDENICAAVLRAHVNAGEWIGVAQCWRSLPTSMKAASAVITALLKALVLLAVPSRFVLSVFRQLKHPNGRQWALVILSACDSSNMDHAARLFGEMDFAAKRSPRAPQPDLYTFSILLYGYIRNDQALRARQTYDEMLLRGLIPDSVTYGTIISAFLRSHAIGRETLDRAHSFASVVFRYAQAGGLMETGGKRHRIGKALYGRLIGYAGRLGRVDDAQSYYDLAVREGVTDLDLMSQLMDAHRHAGQVEPVMSLWSEILSKAVRQRGETQRESYAPDQKIIDLPDGQLRLNLEAPSNMLCIALSITLDALSGAGRHADVKRVWNQVRVEGFGFDASNFQHLAIALLRTGDIEGAFYIVDRVLRPRWKEVQKRRIKTLRQLRSGDLDLENPLIPPPNFRQHELDKKAEFFQDDSSGLDPSTFPTHDDLRKEDPPVSRSLLTSASNAIEPGGDSSTATRRGTNQNRVKQSDKLERALEEEGDDITSQLLANFRPEDVKWRPSRQLRDILNIAYGQIQSQSVRMWNETASQRDKILDSQEASPNALMGDAMEDGSGRSKADDYALNRVELNDDPRKAHYVILPDFNHSPVRGHDGEALLTTPAAVLWRLNRIYPEVIRDIYAHREEIDQYRHERSMDSIDKMIARQETRDAFVLEGARRKVNRGDPSTRLVNLKVMEEEMEEARKNLRNTLVGRIRPVRDLSARRVYGITDPAVGAAKRERRVESRRKEVGRVYGEDMDSRRKGKIPSRQKERSESRHPDKVKETDEQAELRRWVRQRWSTQGENPGR